MINSISSSSPTQSTPFSSYTNNNSKVPDIPDDILTKSNLSNSQLEQRIMELARRDAAAGKNSKFSGKIGNGSDEWQRLMNDYISVASPDRKGIISNSLSNFASKMSSAGIKYNRMNFFQMLFQNNWLSSDIHGNFVDFRDSSGNVAARFSEHQGWMTIATPAEISRMQEFTMVWDKALSTAEAEGNSVNTTSDTARKVIIPL